MLTAKTPMPGPPTLPTINGREGRTRYRSGEIASEASHARASWMLLNTRTGRSVPAVVANASASRTVFVPATIAIGPRCPSALVRALRTTPANAASSSPCGQLRALDPNLCLSNLRERLPFRRDEFIVGYDNGLRQAGLPK
jgi:hypothetical protein